MKLGGLLLIGVGAWALTQVLGGHALDRLGVTTPPTPSGG